MIPSVEQILRENYVDGVFHTHVSMLQPRGKFQFNREKLECFWEVYCTKILEDEDAIVGVAEKPQHYMPVLADIDLKVKESDDIEFAEHLYSETHIKQLIDVYQSVLRNIVEGCTDDHLLCVLLEKPMYYISAGATSYAKNGFHLHFPNLFLSKVDQEVHLIPRVKDATQELRIFSDLGYEDSSVVIDKACCTVPWLIYGSRKSEDMDPYKVTKVFTSDGSEISLDDAFKNYRIYDMREKTIDIKGKIQFFLPRILSIIPYGRPTQEVVQGLISPLKGKLQEQKVKNKKPLKVSVEEALKTSEKLLPMLADFRAEERNEWITIGWILYNIGDASSQALDQWMDFSARCEEKYDEANCIYEWERMTKKDLTLGTLRYFASIDSPQLYKEFKREQAEHYVKESLNGSHNDVAKVLFSEYGTEFVCASISGKTWFQFRDHRWEEIEEGVFLREKISEDVVLKYSEMGSDLFAKLAGNHDKGEEAMFNARLKQVQKIINNLKASPYKSNIMKEAMEVFYDRRFKQKLDQNPYIIGFKNGVYDLKLNEFRAGRPEDFVNKNMPIEYKEYNETDEIVQNVIEFLIKVFPDESIRTYFLDTYSDIFVGGNKQKKVYMWTGEGDNAKSITQKFFELMLGELAIKFNTQYFTGKKVASGSANPELSRAAPPVRHATMEEPDADEQLNIGELKKLSGGDSYWARDLFERGKCTREVFPMFTLTFICNKLPKLKYSDKATWNRIRVIPFESTFVDPSEPCPATLDEQLRQKRFPMDKEFGKKIPDMVSAFAWYLLQWRQKVSVRVEPAKVREATAIYRRQNDIYRQFIEESITEDKNASLTITEMYAQFKEWFKEGWPNMSLPIKNEVKEYFDRLWGDADRGVKWTGYRIRTLQDDVDSGEVIILEEDDLVKYETDGAAAPPM
uniref:SF3 helicase domain-containing protein n=1 Tax=viral metagenome TaxID=1070528 RepID=A0A6C0H449_9ZZZZ